MDKLNGPVNLNPIPRSGDPEGRFVGFRIYEDYKVPGRFPRFDLRWILNYHLCASEDRESAEKDITLDPVGSFSSVKYALEVTAVVQFFVELFKKERGQSLREVLANEELSSDSQGDFESEDDEDTESMYIPPLEGYEAEKTRYHATAQAMTSQIDELKERALDDQFSVLPVYSILHVAAYAANALEEIRKHRLDLIRIVARNCTTWPVNVPPRPKDFAQVRDLIININLAESFSPRPTKRGPDLQSLFTHLAWNLILYVDAIRKSEPLGPRIDLIFPFPQDVFEKAQLLQDPVHLVHNKALPGEWFQVAWKLLMHFSQEDVTQNADILKALNADLKEYRDRFRTNPKPSAEKSRVLNRLKKRLRESFQSIFDEMDPLPTK